jgi:hypothetical protein
MCVMDRAETITALVIEIGNSTLFSTESGSDDSTKGMESVPRSQFVENPHGPWLTVSPLSRIVFAAGDFFKRHPPTIMQCSGWSPAQIL